MEAKRSDSTDTTYTVEFTQLSRLLDIVELQRQWRKGKFVCQNRPRKHKGGQHAAALGASRQDSDRIACEPQQPWSPCIPRRYADRRVVGFDRVGRVSRRPGAVSHLARRGDHELVAAKPIQAGQRAARCGAALVRRAQSMER